MNDVTKRTFGDFCDPLAAGTGDGCTISRWPMAELPQPDALPIEVAFPVGDSMLLLSLGATPKLLLRLG